jgi:nucleoside-diphosphate-sugar epimerase
VERYLVTGALGCLGAWVTRELLRDGIPVIGADVGRDRSRLEALLAPAELSQLTLAHGDVTDLVELERLLADHEITNIVHLAALQVPFCRENPPAGAAVNVVGTVNVFEAARRQVRIERVVYASSIAVYGPEDAGDETERPMPQTHYGVYKVANEGTARIYWQDADLPSIGLRPHTVYGPTRDQGVTSTPTQAMLAAARGEPFHIPWGGVSAYQFTRDVARAFIAASRATLDGSRVYNLPAHRLHMSEVVAAIEQVVPDAAGTITFDDLPLPFPESTVAERFDEEVGPLPRTPFLEGVEATVAFGRRRVPGPAH